MNGPIAQIAALTCHANAFLRGKAVPEFFPANSTCQFCDSVKFIGFSKSLFGKVQETAVAASPNSWFDHLKTERIIGVRLSRTPQHNPEISDRRSAAFVGGGGNWAMETIPLQGTSATWVARWVVWNQNAPERRIWRVDYGRVSKGPPRKFEPVNLDFATTRLRSALADVHSFSEKHDCEGFTACFARAKETLDSGGTKRHGYHKNLSPEGVVPESAAVLLDAVQSAWVFGGMGSWNDMGFAGAEQTEYDRVSEQLFRAVNEAIEAATNASFPASEK
jgi:hypothetical protein